MPPVKRENIKSIRLKDGWLGWWESAKEGLLLLLSQAKRQSFDL
jgi:hypothetical protein